MTHDILSTLRCGFTLLVFSFSLLAACGTVGEDPKQTQNPKSETPNPELETCIKDLVKKLGDNDGAIRITATRGLILIGKSVEPYVQETLKKSSDGEVLSRSKAILKAIPVRERVKFSEVLLKWYPGI